MKTFAWKNIYKFDKETGENKFICLSIIEILPDSYRFLGSVVTVNEGCKVVACDKQGIQKSVEETIADVEEAKLTVENFLLENEILMEGDEVQHE